MDRHALRDTAERFPTARRITPADEASVADRPGACPNANGAALPRHTPHLSTTRSDTPAPRKDH